MAPLVGIGYQVEVEVEVEVGSQFLGGEGTPIFLPCIAWDHIPRPGIAKQKGKIVSRVRVVAIVTRLKLRNN